MKLDTEILNLYLNSNLILPIYPMIEKLNAEVQKDEDDFFKIYLEITLNTDNITSNNMYKNGFDPHYLVDKHMVDILKHLGVNKRDIINVWITVRNASGKIIYP